MLLSLARAHREEVDLRRRYYGIHHLRLRIDCSSKTTEVRASVLAVIRTAQHQLSTPPARPINALQSLGRLLTGQGATPIEESRERTVHRLEFADCSSTRRPRGVRAPHGRELHSLRVHSFALRVRQRAELGPRRHQRHGPPRRGAAPLAAPARPSPIVHLQRTQPNHPELSTQKGTREEPHQVGGET